MKVRILILLCTAALIAGCNNETDNMTDDIAVPVSVEEVKYGSIEEFITTTGTIVAIKEIELQSQISGDYRRLVNPATNHPFKLGDAVRNGQNIIRLSDKEYENNIKIKSQQLSLDISQREYEKQQSLYKKGGVTLRDLKNAEVSFINAQYAYDNAKIQTDKFLIKSPFDGVIVDLPYYTPDTRIVQGKVMAKLMNYSRMYMEVNMAGKEIGVIKPGQTVRVMNYTLPDDTLYGAITEVSPAIDPATRTFKAAITIENPQLLLRPGMFVKAELVIAKNDSALIIPKDVIISRQRGKTVYIVRKGAAQQRTITIGLSNPDKVEVLSGLEVNDRLVIDGFETLRNRSKVKIIR